MGWVLIMTWLRVSERANPRARAQSHVHDHHHHSVPLQHEDRRHGVQTP